MLEAIYGARLARRIPTLAIFTIVTWVAGCGGGGPVSSVSPTSSAHAAETETQPAGAKFDCDALHAAHVDLSLQLQTMLFMDSDEAYARQADPNAFQAAKLDATKLRQDIELLAALPEPKYDNPYLRPLSKVIPRFRELADLLESCLRSGHPFSDGSGNGEKLKKLAEQLSVEGRVAISRAYEAAGCKPR